MSQRCGENKTTAFQWNTESQMSSNMYTCFCQFSLISLVSGAAYFSIKFKCIMFGRWFLVNIHLGSKAPHSQCPGQMVTGWLACYNDTVVAVTATAQLLAFHQLQWSVTLQLVLLQVCSFFPHIPHQHIQCMGTYRATTLQRSGSGNSISGILKCYEFLL
jgi:hypothetical protein